jgi:hypothetical protein
MVGCVRHGRLCSNIAEIPAARHRSVTMGTFVQALQATQCPSVRVVAFGMKVPMSLNPQIGEAAKGMFLSLKSSGRIWPKKGLPIFGGFFSS